MDTTDAIKQFLDERSDDAFANLFKAFHRRLCRYFVMLKLDEASAEDLAQNVMMTVYQKADELRDVNRFEGWLFAIARNAMLMHRRRQSRRPVEINQFTDEILNNSSVTSTTNTRLLEWVSHFNSDDQKLIRLRYIEGLSYEELASTLKLPLGTVKWRLFNIKKQLMPIIKQG